MFCTSFRSLCAVDDMAVYCSSLISCSHGMLLRYCVSDFEMVPVASIITGITFSHIPHEMNFCCKYYGEVEEVFRPVIECT